MSATRSGSRIGAAGAVALLAAVCLAGAAGAAGAAGPAAAPTTALRFAAPGTPSDEALAKDRGRRADVERLAAAGDFEGAATVCYGWLFEDPRALWPMIALAKIHERCGALPLARKYAALALDLQLEGGGPPSDEVFALNRRIREKWLAATPPAVTPPLFCKPAAP